MGQELDIKQARQSRHNVGSDLISSVQIEDGADFRVLISPLPPKVEEVKKVEKVKEKKADNRSVMSFIMI